MPDLYPFQRINIDKCMQFLDVLGVAYIADEMGLGKTCQAIRLTERRGHLRILCIVPASLKLNWLREFSIWHHAPDSLTLRVESYAFLTRKPNLNSLLVKDWDCIIFDEAHYLKNPNSKRTQACLSLLVKQAREVIYLSGTPIVNSAIDVYPVFHCILPEVFPKYWSFAHKYCHVSKRYLPSLRRTITQVEGIRNAAELKEIARSNFMVRNLKKDVLTELPDKTIANIELELKAKELKDIEIESVTEARLIKSIEDGRPLSLADEKIAKVRRLIGTYKVKPGAGHILSLLESEKSLVVFAYHRDVIEELSAHLSKKKIDHGIIDGRTAKPDRQKIVDMFQARKLRVVIGQIQAAGVGLTLTAAKMAVFLESDWSPAMMQQAVDRVHRITQTEKVLVHILSAKNTIDSRINNVLQIKLRAVNAFN